MENGTSKAIKIAIDNGYRNLPFFMVQNAWNVYIEGKVICAEGIDGSRETMHVDEITKNPHKYLLDTLFWQALGKGLGWGNVKDDICQCGQLSYKFTYPWQKYWHLFIDHLSEGKDINSFFDTLLQGYTDDCKAIGEQELQGKK